MKHTFAIYYTDTSKLTQRFKLTDKDLIHRLVHILRLQQDERITFFNRTHHAIATLDSIDKKNIEFVVSDLERNNSIVPAITMLLPLLKRESLDEAVYNLVQAGVSTIQLVITDNVHRAWGGQKEMERLERLIIAAAEQSKNFSFPEIKPPIELPQAIDSSGGFLVYADPEGEAFFSVMQKMQSKKPESITLLIGPEADLSQEEKSLIISRGYLFCRLTPTILRAREAAFLFTGAVRSCL